MTEREVFSRNGSIQQAINTIKSPKFELKLRQRNLPPEYLSKVLDICDLSENDLIQRGQELEEGAVTALEDSQIPGEFVIPYSGGRDSTLITYLLRKHFPQRVVNAVTVLTGLSKYPEGAETPKDHLQRILHPMGLDGSGPNYQHYYLDMSAPMDEFAIASAMEDKDKLGFPGICSTCKIIMELGISEVAEILDAPNLFWGHVKYQALQQWPEQTQEYRGKMNDYVQEAFPDINSTTPLWNVLEYPTDSLLLMGWLGVPPEKQKGEAKCAAGGLNPVTIDGDRLLSFMEGKLEQLPASLLADTIKECPVFSRALMEAVIELKKDPEFTEGVFQES